MLFRIKKKKNENRRNRKKNSLDLFIDFTVIYSIQIVNIYIITLLVVAKDLIFHKFVLKQASTSFHVPKPTELFIAIVRRYEWNKWARFAGEWTHWEKGIVKKRHRVNVYVIKANWRANGYENSDWLLTITCTCEWIVRLFPAWIFFTEIALMHAIHENKSAPNYGGSFYNDQWAFA